MQVNQAIEANIVRPELPEEADRVEQLLVEFRAVQQRIHDLNQVTILHNFNYVDNRLLNILSILIFIFSSVSDHATLES